MELVFKALGDRHRRLLLDRLLERDGQTLGELDAALPNMTRFGVMKHLGVLQTANLVTVRRVGRRKLHYLNPAPIQLVLERWFGKYTHATAASGARPTMASETPGGVRVGARHTGCDQEPWGRRTVGPELPRVPRSSV